MKRDILNWKSEAPAALEVRRVLPRMVREYFKAGRKLDVQTNPRLMHAFRLKTKHLRYTLEAFEALYGAAIKPKIDALRPIQNALGESNDCEVLLALIGGQMPVRARAAISRRAQEKRQEFLRYWREEFDAAGEDKKWEGYLKRATPNLVKTSQVKKGVAKK
jgi:CHAD domain-containing protein